MTLSPKPDYDADNRAFVERVVDTCKDRGKRAALRYWWSPATRHHAFPVLGALGAIDDDRRTLIATLYAVHAMETFSAHQAKGPRLGTAALRLGGGNAQATGFESMERHFKRLLACDTLKELEPHLHRLAKRLQRESIPLDYTDLLKDLRLFGNHAEQVKIRWAKDFWQAPDLDQSPTALSA